MLINFVDATNDANHYTKLPPKVGLHMVAVLFHIINFTVVKRCWLEWLWRYHKNTAGALEVFRMSSRKTVKGKWSVLLVLDSNMVTMVISVVRDWEKHDITMVTGNF